MGKPLVYVAGPITGDPFGAVRNSVWAFHAIRNRGGVPFMPQRSVVPEMVEHQEHEAWMKYDFDIIGNCAGLFRLEGESKGADREVELAKELGIPVWFDDPFGFESTTKFLKASANG